MPQTYLRLVATSMSGSNGLSTLNIVKNIVVKEKVVGFSRSAGQSARTLTARVVMCLNISDGDFTK